MRVHRTLHLIGATDAPTRLETFESRQHLVVPVVALVGDEVVYGMNAPGPELVPAEVIAKSHLEWCGRPVVGIHPERDGKSVSANEPRVYEKECFGRIANPTFRDNRLILEAWLDIAKAEKVGPYALSVIDRAQKSQPIEVSIGAYVEVDEISGTTPSGKSYVGIWRSIGSDHLAMLPEGVSGACSNDMGCGAPRIAIRHMVTKNGLEIEKLTPNKENKEESKLNESKKKTLRERLSGLFSGGLPEFLRFRTEEEGSVSDMDLRQALDRALFSSEPGYLGIDAVFPLDSIVVYAVAPEQKVILYRRGYSLAEDGAISLADDKEEVEPVTRYEPVNAAAAPTVNTTVSTNESTNPNTNCPCHKKGDIQPMSKVSEIIDRLITNKSAPFNKGQEKTLEALGESVLEDLDKKYQVQESQESPKEEPKPANPPSAPTTPETPKAPDTPNTTSTPETPPNTVNLSRDEFESMKAAAAAFRSQQEERKSSLISILKGAQKTYSEDDLKAMNVSGLEKLADVLEVNKSTPKDYSGRLTVSSSPDVDEDDIELYRPPDSWRVNRNSKDSKDSDKRKEN